MNPIVAATEVKKKGISAIDPILKEYGEAYISVRGQTNYIVLAPAEYQMYREYQLDKAIAEAEADLKTGDCHTGSADEHLEYVKQFMDEV